MPGIEIYSTDTDSGVISVIHASNGRHERITQVPVGNAPRGSVKFTKDGRGFVSNCGGDTISEIDVLTHRETTRIKVGPAPRGIGIIPGDRFALVSNSGANTLSIVDLTARRELVQIAIGRDPRHMVVTPDGKYAYVAVWGAHYVAKIDVSALSAGPSAAAVEQVREVARIPVGGEVHPYSVSFQPETTLLWVANTQGESVTIIDTAKDEVVGEVVLGLRGARAIAFSVDGSTAYVTIENSSQVAVVDTESHEVLELLPVGAGPRGIALEPKSDTLYVAAFGRAVAGGNREGEEPPPDTLTVLELQATSDVTVIEDAGAEPGAAGRARRPVNARTGYVGVGKGPCAVAVLDTSGLRLGGRTG
jgi:YVTN family beta-propeller protein